MIKQGKEIKSEQDLQNLVIGVLNRQTKDYTQKEVESIIKNYTKNSTFKVSNEMITKMVTDNINYLYRKGMVDCKNGVYSPERI